MTTAALGQRFRGHGDLSRQVSEALIHARLDSARQLPDAELAELERSSGIAGLLAKHVLSARRVASLA